MANDLNSNVTQKVAKIFLKEFQSARVASKAVTTDLITPQFTPDFGEQVRFKRPHQYRAIKTPGGDISASTKNAIISGSAPADVQEYITVPIDWTNREEALELNQLQEIIRPAALECATKMDNDLTRFMVHNSGLHYGTPGTAISKWSDVAGPGSIMEAIGVPQGDRMYMMNPFAAQDLADTQSGLASGDNNLVNTAWREAQISRNFGGLKAMMANSLVGIQLGALAGSSGTVSATPNGTYLTHKDSMIQTITLTGLTVSTTDALRPGDTIEITQANRARLNLKTREVVFDSSGPLKWTYKVVTGGDTDGAGTVTITVTSAAINETDGQYQNIENPITAGDTFTILGTANATVQPNLFFHKQAFGLGTIKLPKLHTWDTVITSADGISIRVTKYADGDKNEQSIRFDLLPIHSVLNPQFAGTGFGVP